MDNKRINEYYKILKKVNIDIDIYNQMNEIEQINCKNFISNHIDYRDDRFELKIENMDNFSKFIITCILCGTSKDITDYTKINK